MNFLLFLLRNSYFIDTMALVGMNKIEIPILTNKKKTMFPWKRVRPHDRKCKMTMTMGSIHRTKKHFFSFFLMESWALVVLKVKNFSIFFSFCRCRWPIMPFFGGGGG